MTKKTTITAAALGAIARGDLENYLVASTPGGIRAQEAEGQRRLVVSSTLPIAMFGATRQQLTALGFVFGEDVDRLFVQCTLPPGWKKQATEHNMHSDLLDEQGRCRADIFYKAAFYDQRADMRMCRRYEVRADAGRCSITDAGKEIYHISNFDDANYAAYESAVKRGTEWLDENYPQWGDPLAYW